MCTALLEFMAMEVHHPTFPVVSTETMFQLLVVVQPLELVAYLRPVLVAS